MDDESFVTLIQQQIRIPGYVTLGRDQGLRLAKLPEVGASIRKDTTDLSQPELNLPTPAHPRRMVLAIMQG